MQFIFSISFVNIILLYTLNKIFRYYQIYDLPSRLKYHSEPTPKGSGVIILISIIAIIIKYYSINIDTTEFDKIFIRPFFITFLITSIVLGFMSIYDDYFFIHHIWRLLIQILVVFLMINTLRLNAIEQLGSIFIFDLPNKIFLTLFFFGSLFIINSTNFIDGVDGHFAFYGLLTSIFYCFFAKLHNYVFFYELNFLFIFTFLIMLFFNFNHKVKFFSGDVGTILFGYVLSINFIIAVISGNLLSVVFLHIFVFTDICSTLIKKLLRRENIFQRHRDFLFYSIYKKNKFFIFFINFLVFIFAICILLIGY